MADWVNKHKDPTKSDEENYKDAERAWNDVSFINKIATWWVFNSSSSAK